MPRASGEKQYNTFTKGLITEANPLTYPENSFLDGDNIVLNRDGSIVRRLGIDYEDGYSLVATTLTGATVSFHSWEFAGGSSGVSLGVVRVRDRLYFMDMTSAAPSSNLKNGGNYITLAGLSNARIETTVINNNLVVVGSELNYPIYLEYNPTTDVVSQSAISIKVRDFWGVDDGLTLKETPSTLSKEHHYNLKNQGWIYHVVDVKVQSGTYPSNSDMYHYGKFEDKWKYTYFSNNREALAQAPKGHFILDIYNRGTSRTTETGLTLDNDGELGRISTATTYSGRVFYAGVASEVVGGDKYSPNYSGYVFFTKTVGTKEDLSICYQEADPTSADISDIIATDGGTLAIPEANRIVRLAAVGNSLIIFSENGVWEVYGTSDSGFKATEYSLRKITNIGVRNPDSVVVAGDSIFYWAKSGIFMLSTEQVSGRLQAQNISLATIQTFYDTLPAVSRENAKGFYDQKENKVRWLYDTENEDSTECNTTSVVEIAIIDCAIVDN